MQTVVNNVLLNYEIVGSKNKKTILILHGWMRSLDEWLPVAQELANTYKIIALDLPGFGKSPLLENTKIDIFWYADIVQKFMKQLNVKEAVGMGHSFGGRILFILASKTKLFSSLILVDAAGTQTKDIVTQIKIAIAKIGKVILLPFPKSIRIKFSAIIAPDYGTLSKEKKELFKNTVNENLIPFAKKVTCKTLLIWGEKDEVVPINEALKIREYIPNATLRVVWTAGHLPHVEKRDKFVKILKEYL
jgi:pimeloyl-ACP methyl ester carboxylesterase